MPSILEGSTTLEEVSPQDEAKSVFDLEYIPTSKARDFSVLTSGYFTIYDTAVPSTSKESKAFWRIIVNVISELHEEKYSMHNTLSDSVSIFSTGAKPIAVSISGYVLLSKTDDHLYELLNRYVNDFRARHLSANNKHLTFVSQDTKFNLIIQSISMGHTVQMETYVPVTISGLAYRYAMDDSEEPLYLGYYGTNGQQSDALGTSTDSAAGDGEVSKKRGLKLSGQNNGLLDERLSNSSSSGANLERSGARPPFAK
jgi:hypothetical protein